MLITATENLTWLPSLSIAQLRQIMGPETFQRGETYFHTGRVGPVTGSSRGILLASVQGSGGREYSVFVRVTEKSVSGNCSCPVGSQCKHVVAVVLQALAANAARTGGGAGLTKAPPSSWESMLTPLLDTSTPDADTAAGAPLALQLEWVVPQHHRYAVIDYPRVQLRPMVPGKRGGWVKTGVSWDNLISPYRRVEVNAAHREALIDLCGVMQARQRSSYSYYSSDISVYLDSVGPQIWQLLRQIIRTGVVLVAENQKQPAPVLLDGTASVVMDFHAGEADVTVQPRLLVNDEQLDPKTVAWIGDPAHGLAIPPAVDRPMMLAQLRKPLDPAMKSLLTYPGDITIPAADTARFMAAYYPKMSRRAEVISSDNTVEFPTIAPPRLGVQVEYAADHQLRVSWVFRYQVGSEVVSVPVTAAATADDQVDRDLPAERKLLADIDFPDGLGLTQMTPLGTRELLGQQHLRGVATATFTTSVLPVLQSRENIDVILSGEPADYRELTDAPVISVATADIAASDLEQDLDGEGQTDDETDADEADRSRHLVSPAATTDTDWFNLTVEVTVAGEQVPFGELFAALARGEEFLMLDSGAWFRIDIPELDALRRIISEARELSDAPEGQLHLTRYQAGLWEELVSLGVVATQSRRWQESVGALLDLTSIPDPAPPLGLTAQLRPYQHEGFRWLSLLWDLRLGGILADDMGLGKTLQTLAMLTRAHEAGQLKHPVLIVVPTSVIPTWVGEAAKFAPDLRVAMVTETPRRSGVLLSQSAADAQIVVTSYALFRIEYEAFSQLEWSGLILDEAQFVKNHQAKTYQCARRLSAPMKIAMTGTPLENSLMDLWSLLSIVAPGLFADPQKFGERYRRPIESGADPQLMSTLRRRIRPLMLRRTKEQVASDLPPKQEQVLQVALAPAHRALYDRRLARERQKVLGLLGDLNKNRFEIFRSLTMLRQLSLDPILTEKPPPAKAVSAKLDTLVDYLREISVEGHRALVFSQFTGFLQLARNRLDDEGIAYSYLDGRTRNRAQRIEEFTKGTQPAFLISLKAGGFGLTLTEADYVFVLDPWWNPAAEAQAIDRTHRIGQTKKVNVYRLVSQDTIEEKVVALQERKRELFANVMDDGDLMSSPLSVADIRGLLT